MARLEYYVSLPPVHAGAYGRLLWVLLILLVLPATSADAGATAVIHTVDVGPEHVVVRLSAPSAFTQAALPKDLEHQRADRCYIDVSPAVLGQLVRHVYAVNSARIQQVRVAQFRPTVVRIVLDLITYQPCRVEKLADPDRLHLTVGYPQDEKEERDQKDESAARAIAPLSTSRPVGTTEPPPLTDTPLEYLDLRTLGSPETEQTRPTNLFGRSRSEPTAPR